MTLVVLMAGGRGLRLRPLTDKIPKPMARIGEKPILQQAMEDFQEQGFDRFVFCVGYRAEVIRSYFGDGSRFGCEIAYIQDPPDQPTGTAGALRHLGVAADGEIIVQNADIVTSVDYAELIRFHKGRNADATICAASYQHQIPYGVLNVQGDYIAGVTLEKPVIDWPINAGIYVLSSRAVGMVPDGPSNMPDLLDRLDTVAVFPLRNHWTDVGTLVSYREAGGTDQ